MSFLKFLLILQDQLQYDIKLTKFKNRAFNLNIQIKIWIFQITRFVFLIIS
jgi:hypothetical protein